MTSEELKAKLEDLYELINNILPTDREEMKAPPQDWIEVNDLCSEIAEATQKQSDFWRNVAARG